MTRKHYKALAEIVKSINDDVIQREVAQQIANMCQADNERFDRSRFFDACMAIGAV